MGDGFLADLRYFGPGLGPGRGIDLARRKIRKALGKRRLARALAAEDSDETLFARLGVPGDRVVRLSMLREAWSPLAASLRLAPVLSQEEQGSIAAGTPVGIPEMAEAVLAGRQVLFGRTLEVGWPPRWDWRWNGTENADLFARDVRSTWELQRLQGILPLAAASRGPEQAGNERNACAYLDALLGFYRAHPGPGGIAWASALELGLRLVALTQGLPQVSERDAFAAKATLVLRVLDRHARWLAADLSLDKVVPGNHLLGELSGLLAAGCLLPSARPAWWGSLDVPRLLETEILRQFHPDGVNVEQSLTYEAFILEFLTVAGELARLRGEPFSAPVRERLLDTARHLEAATLPGGDLPRVGDCDSGRGAWFGVTDPHRPGVAILRARAVFGDRNLEEPKRAISPADPGVPSDGHASVLKTAGGTCVHRFPSGGHVVVRRDEGDYLFLRGGPFGWGVHGPASHSHADWLSPVLVMAGEPVLVDPGVYGYDLEQGLRDGFRNWPAHGGIRSGPAYGPHPAGVFRWTGFGPAASLEAVLGGEGVEVRGQVRWAGPGPALLWQRSIHYNELQRGWLLRDRVLGPAGETREWGFPFAPGIQVTPESVDGVYRLDLPSGRSLRMRLDPAGPASLERGWVAVAYGRREEALVLVRRLAPGREEARTEILSG